MNAPIFRARLSRFVLLAAFAAAAGLANAGEGHDHGDAPPAAAGTASPRILAHSDLFELVGVLDKGQLTVWLDRYATNEPVAGAKIEYEAGANKGVAAPQPDGTYLVKFDGLDKPGEHAFQFTVTAGADTDLLAGDLDIHEDHHDEPAARKLPAWAIYSTGAAVLAAAAFFLLRKRREARRPAQLG